MDALHEQALSEDRWRDPEYRREAKRKVQMLIGMTEAISVGNFNSPYR